MNSRKTLLLVVVAMFVMSLPTLADSVAYIGQFFDCITPTCFCARVTNGDCDSVVGASLYFTGENLWKQKYVAGFGFDGSTTGPQPLVTTGGLGIGCAEAVWPPNVYKVQAIAGATDCFAGGESFPSVVTIISPFWCGVFAGGQLCLDDFIDSRGFKKFCEPRTASVGFIYALPRLFMPESKPNGGDFWIDLPCARNQGLWLIDPLGPTCIKSDNFTACLHISCNRADSGILPSDGKGKFYVELLVKGVAQFNRNGVCECLPFEAKISPGCHNRGKFAIRVFKAPYGVIYEACEEVKNGKVVFALHKCIKDMEP